MEEFNLKRSEVKKAERFATNKSGETCFLAAWSYSGADDLGWADVLCEMGNTNTGEYVNTDLPESCPRPLQTPHQCGYNCRLFCGTKELPSRYAPYAGTYPPG